MRRGKGGKGAPGPDSHLSEWLDFLESLHPKGQAGIELGLERVLRVKAALGQSQHCPVIAVGGTNGKGSTCAYLETILHVAGYRVGCFTSPHLFAYNERVRLNRKAVEDGVLCAAFDRVDTARQQAGQVALTYFEFGTLAAWEVFAGARVDVIILEVGLGGRLDAVNAYDADVALVTTIDLDHTEWLGNTREAIAYEKAGIFRAGKVAFCADSLPPQSLLDHAQSIGVSLRLIGRDFGYDLTGKEWRWWGGDQQFVLPQPALTGEAQYHNAAIALAALQALPLPLAQDAMVDGLQQARLPGRFEIVRERPLVVVDVAHNPQAVRELANNLKGLPGTGRMRAVVGMLADKDADAALSALKGKIDVWHLATLQGWRGAPAERLAAVVAACELGGEVYFHASPQEAMHAVLGSASESDRILAFGSFYTVAGVMDVLGYGR